AGFRETIRFFSVDDWPGLIEPVDEGGIFSMGPAFLRASAHAEISVAERGHRFRLGQEFGVKRLVDHVPLVGRIITRWRPEAFMVEHRAVSPETARSARQPTSSLRSRTTTFAPCCLSASASPLRATPITSAKLPLRPA